MANACLSRIRPNNQDGFSLTRCLRPQQSTGFQPVVIELSAINYSQVIRMESNPTAAGNVLVLRSYPPIPIVVPIGYHNPEFPLHVVLSVGVFLTHALMPSNG